MIGHDSLSDGRGGGFGDTNDGFLKESCNPLVIEYLREFDRRYDGFLAPNLELLNLLSSDISEPTNFSHIPKSKLGDPKSISISFG